MNNEVTTAGVTLQLACFGTASRAGWWTDLKTGEPLNSQAGEPPKVQIPEKLMLIVSEVAEAMEGHRKGLMDNHLPHRTMLEVELADTVIRCFDLAGGLGLSLGLAISEKLAYNASREDHKLETRRGVGGKAY